MEKNNKKKGVQINKSLHVPKMSSIKKKTLMSPKEIGTALGVTINTVREWKNKGCPYKEANPYGIGKTSTRPRYDIEQVKAWLAVQNRKEEK